MGNETSASHRVRSFHHFQHLDCGIRTNNKRFIMSQFHKAPFFVRFHQLSVFEFVPGFFFAISCTNCVSFPPTRVILDRASEREMERKLNFLASGEDTVRKRERWRVLIFQAVSEKSSLIAPLPLPTSHRTGQQSPGGCVLESKTMSHLTSASEPYRWRDSWKRWWWLRWDAVLFWKLFTENDSAGRSCVMQMNSPILDISSPNRRCMAGKYNYFFGIIISAE